MPHASQKSAASIADMTTQRDELDFYAHEAAMTSPGDYAPMLDVLPRDVAALARIVQGLAVHEYVASPFYGVTVSEERKSESHIRPVQRMLQRLLASDARPLTVARTPEKRLVGVCHHFMKFFVTMLRAKGIPARARWGFGSYFNPGFFEDHTLVEYWNAVEARWVRADAQLDEVWQDKMKLDFDVLDVPHNRFIIAGDAWAQCREGKADASKFGIFQGNLRGLWFIACNLVKDVAALNKMETLPWDIWGAMPQPGTTLQDGQLEFFDRIAELTRAPDASFAELRKLYEGDERLRVPATVFNSVLNRPEAILTE